MIRPAVLITGARSAAALDWARRYSAAGFDVHTADCSLALLTKFSNIKTHSHRYRTPRYEFKGFCEDISNLLNKINPALVIPTCEEVFHLGRVWEKKSMSAPLFAPPIKDLTTLHRKDRFIELCDSVGIQVPATQPYDPQMDPAAWVFKPVFSRFGSSTFIDAHPPQVSAHRDWIQQKKISGDEASFYAVCEQGNVIGFSAYRSDWRLPGGASYAFQPVAPGVHDQLKNSAEILAKAMTITGQIACDAIIDEDGQAWLIECNPRATSGLHLLTDDPSWPAQLCAGRSAVYAGQIDRPAYLEPAMLTFGRKAARQTGRHAEWRALRKSGTGVLRSRGASIGAVIDSAGFAVLGLRKRISLEAATTYDIEWNGT